LEAEGSVSRADEIRARYEDELAVAEFEDQLVAAKQDGTVTPEMKLALREARQAYRLRREGSAVAQAETIQTASTVGDDR
jgi:hypothetical protein